MFLKKVFYSTGILLACSITFPLKSLANLTPNQHNLQKEINFIPPEDGEEPDTKGAGTRNSLIQKCNADKSAIQVIMPDNNYGLTTQERPKIFFLLSETTATQVVLSFQNKEDKYHEVAFLPIDLQQGVIGFSLPKDKLPLAIDKYYQWRLTFVCNETPNVNDPIFTGWVKRIDVQHEDSELKLQSALERAKWYGVNGYWYDLLEQAAIASEADSTSQINSNWWLQLIERY